MSSLSLISALFIFLEHAVITFFESLAIMSIFIGINSINHIIQITTHQITGGIGVVPSTIMQMIGLCSAIWALKCYFCVMCLMNGCNQENPY